MFNWIGANAVEGAKDQMDAWLKSLTPQSMEAYIGQLPVVAQFSSMFKDIEAGYNGMSDQQKAAFWTSVFIMATKVMATA